MSWGTCYSGSNNIHFDYPPIMDDGRNYASWQPGAVINENIRHQNKINSNWKYREFLTKNADTIIKQNQKDSCDQCGYCPINNKSVVENNGSPYLYNSPFEKSQPYGYEDSDLKNIYLSRNELEARMVSPAISQEQVDEHMKNMNMMK